MCTRAISFALFYVVFYVAIAFTKALQLSVSVEQSDLLALSCGCALGLAEQPQEAEPCGQRGSWVSQTPLGDSGCGGHGAEKGPRDTPSPAAPAALQDEELRAAAARWLFLQHQSDNGRVPGARRDLASTSCSHQGRGRKRAREHRTGCAGTCRAVPAAVSVLAAVAQIPA